MSEISDSPQEKRRPQKVTVIGAGFSGLASAFFLVRAGYEVEIHDSSERVGGLISTAELPEGLAESAANGMLNSPLVEEIGHETGIQMQAVQRASRRRFIFRGGRARRWPLSLLATLHLALFAVRYIFARAQLRPRQGETVQSWGARTLGVEASRYTIETALQGIYAGDTTRMSASLILGRFFTHETSSVDATLRQSKKSLIRGTVAPVGGMQKWTTGLRKYLEQRGVTFHLHEKYNANQLMNEKVKRPVVIATGAASAAELLAIVDAKRAQYLNRIEKLSLVSTTVFFKDALPKLAGFGCLFPPVEKRQVLGVLMNNFIFQGAVQAGVTSETWMMGGALAPKMAGGDELSDAEVLARICEERRACFGARSEVVNYKIHRWANALPHYTVELENFLPLLQPVHENVVLIGNYLGQIGLAKILERANRLPAMLAADGHWTE
jgi:oxygen-dependent protoporphyrinogen oxidase